MLPDHEMAHDIDRLRGNVISNFAYIESILNDTLALEYASKEKNHQDLFRHEVLEHKYFSFEFKKSLLQQIIKRKYPGEWSDFPDKDLQNMQSYRNIVAHALLKYYPPRSGEAQKEGFFFEYQGKRYQAHKLIQQYMAKMFHVQSAIEAYSARAAGK